MKWKYERFLTLWLWGSQTRKLAAFSVIVDDLSSPLCDCSFELVLYPDINRPADLNADLLEVSIGGSGNFWMFCLIFWADDILDAFIIGLLMLTFDFSSLHEKLRLENSPFDCWAESVKKSFGKYFPYIAINRLNLNLTWNFIFDSIRFIDHQNWNIKEYSSWWVKAYKI